MDDDDADPSTIQYYLSSDSDPQMHPKMLQTTIANFSDIENHVEKVDYNFIESEMIPHSYLSLSVPALNEYLQQR